MKVQETNGKDFIQDEVPQTPVKKKSKLLRYLKFFLIVIGLILVISIGYSIFNTILPKQHPKYLENSYSEDQEKVISEFGKPDTFSVVANIENEAKVMRSEVWRYLELGEVFLFEDGQFQSRVHHDFNLPANSTLISPQIEPRDTYGLNLVSNLNSLLGSEPNSWGDLNPEILDEKIKIYSYDGLITAAEMDDQLIFVKTHAVYQPESTTVTQDTQVAPSEKELSVIESEDDAWKTGRVFSPDNKLSVFVDVDLQPKIYVVTEKIDDALVYNFCLVDDSMEDDFFCDQGSYPIFSISEYEQTAYEAMENSLYAAEETLLLQQDGIYYTFSHPNGFIPEPLMGRADDFYDQIMESFVLTEEMQEEI